MLKQHTIEFCNSLTKERTCFLLSVAVEYELGSDTGNNLSLGGVSPEERYASLILDTDGLYIAQINQSDISVNGRQLTISKRLNHGDSLALGNTDYQIFFDGFPPEAAVHIDTPLQVLTIGRLTGCDWKLDSPLVSRVHAQLYLGTDWVEIEDKNSVYGTFVNGRRISIRERLNAGDRVDIASFSYLFNGGSLNLLDTSGQVRLEVRGLTKDVRPRSAQSAKRLLENVDLAIEPGEFVVIFGTSGCGKSTLLDALSGRRPANYGSVLYNGVNLYDTFDLFRSSIGYAPQQDIVHRKISVEQALRYTALLRLPSDTSNEEIETSITQVLYKMGLTEKAVLPIDTPPLSGGQFKRVNLAVELIANPRILFLDEVTSGLDAATDKRMMQLFANLAEEGRTVVCVTHTLENIDLCSLVLLLHKGRLVYFGPPQDVSPYFGTASATEIYDLLETEKPKVWEEKFRESKFYRLYVEQRLAVSPVPSSAQSMVQRIQLPTRSVTFHMKQTMILTRRYFDVMFADKRKILILLLQAPLIAFLIGFVFYNLRKDAGLICFFLVLSAIWFGTNNSCSEIVKELPVYLRERSVNLGIGPYIASKLLPLLLLCLIQCMLLLGIVSLLLTLPGNFADRTVCLFATGLAATCMGLTISAFVDTNDKAVAIAPILLIPQTLMANAVIPLAGIRLAAAKASMISFWAFDAMKATLNSNMGESNPVLGNYWGNLVLLFMMGIFFLGLAAVGLRWKDQRY